MRLTAPLPPIYLEPAIGLEPMTCALRVRPSGISHNPPSLLRPKIPTKPRLLRRKGNSKTPDGGEGAPKKKPSEPDGVPYHRTHTHAQAANRQQ